MSWGEWLLLALIVAKGVGLSVLWVRTVDAAFEPELRRLDAEDLRLKRQLRELDRRCL